MDFSRCLRRFCAFFDSPCSYFGLSGCKVSFNYQQNTSIEAYLLDFDKMIYDKTVTFRFHRFLREEQKFAGMQELKEQLLKDCDRARNYFRQRKEG